MPTKRIILIEEQPAVRESLKRGLGFRGHTVIALDNAAAARQELLIGKPELLLSDVSLRQMPEGIGLALWARERWPDLPIILMSSLHSPSLPPLLHSDPRVNVLAKPFGLSDLLLMMHKMLSQPTPGSEPPGDEGED
jgi:two-component system response regulator PrrA